MNKFEGSLINRPKPPQEERGEPTAEALDRLQTALDNCIIKNSDGVDIKLHVTREKLTATSEELWYVTFEYKYRDRVIHRTYPRTDDYVKLSVTPNTHSIGIGMAQLETSMLKGKHVYPQVIQLLSENFPAHFDLVAEFGHDATKQEILKARDEYQRGQIDIEQLKQKILQSYLFRTRVAAGFNRFELSFSTSSGGEVYLEVKSRKGEIQGQPELTIVGL